MTINPQRAQALFLAALELSEPAARRELLDRECDNDIALRQRVEALLGAHDAAGGFGAEPSGPEFAATFEPPTVASPGTLLAGRYKLIEAIGEGGMGSVWLAEQKEPVKRKVAIKLIKAGMDSKQVLARFEAERQALAVMDHPNIAKVFDGGMTDQGRPFFVMEYVKGVPLTEYCDQARLSLKERLNLFTPVCQAVQHAHQKGIIHRDLKPSNILICLYDGKPVPKVIDFGLAKAMHQSLTEQSLHTAHGVMVGTPLYMSPEQAEHNNLDVDTRTDIYSLGVILYELLTGSTPLEKLQLKEAAFNEILRLIKEVEPPKPSTRLSSSLSLPSIAAQRSIDPNQLKRSLIGDLDWIVMKALDKERSRRYETANGLARDVERFLNDEAVEACPPSAAYKFRKYIRRNRGQVIAAATVLTVLMLGMAGTTGGMIWANKERAHAEAEKSKATLAAVSEAEAKVQAQANEQKAISAAKRAETSKEQEAKARKRAETISEFVTTSLKASDAQNTGGDQDMTILAAMDNAIADIDSGRFKDDPETEAELKNTIATILLNNGRVAEAERLAAQVLDTCRRLFAGDNASVANCMDNLANARRALGRSAEAEALIVQSLEINQRLYKGDHPQIATSLNNLAEVLNAQGRYEEAEPLFVRSLDMTRRLYKGDHPQIATTLNNVAHARVFLRRAAEAEPLMEQALEMQQRLFKGDNPAVAMSLDNLAKVRFDLGRVAEAEALLVEALEMRRRLYKGDHPDLAIGLNNLAGARRALGRTAEIELLLVESLEMNRRLFRGDHPVVAQRMSNLAIVLEELDRAAEAEPLFVQSLEMSQRLFRGDHADIADSLNNLASVRLTLDRSAEAEPLFVQSLEMWRRLSKGDSVEVATNLSNLARAQLALGKAGESRQGFDEAVAMFRRLSPEGSPLFARVLWRSGSARIESEDAATALPELEEAVAMAEKILPPEHSQLKEYRETLAKYKVALLEKANPPADGDK